MTLEEYISSLRGKKIGVVGIGVSNRPLLELLLRGGCDVTACDRGAREKLGEEAERLEALGCRLVLGPDYLKELDFDVIFRTPGLHPFTPELSAAAARGAILTSEMEAFFRLCPCRIIAVTGSDGKTTTTTILSELLKAAGYTVWLGGNIGTPLLDRVPDMHPGDWAVLELSSFQLHSMDCRPDVAVVTNVSPNHLDIHPSFDDYVDAKRSIFRRQRPDDVLVLNRDNDITRSFADEAPGRVRFFSRRETVADGCFCADDGGERVIFRARGGTSRALLKTGEIFIPGDHNIENFMAAFAAVDGLVSDDVCRRVAREFPGVKHRLEMLRTLRGVTYCNDSIASSPTRTIAGLRSFALRPILIAGGYDKHIPFDGLGDEICRRVKALVLTGATADMIRAAVERSPLYDPERLPVVTVDDFREAVLTASRMAEAGDLVLLSPACASFDKFPNFARRGDAFREIVMALE